MCKVNIIFFLLFFVGSDTFNKNELNMFFKYLFLFFDPALVLFHYLGNHYIIIFGMKK